MRVPVMVMVVGHSRKLVVVVGEIAVSVGNRERAVAVNFDRALALWGSRPATSGNPLLSSTDGRSCGEQIMVAKP